MTSRGCGLYYFYYVVVSRGCRRCWPSAPGTGGWALERLQHFILAHLADPAAILVLDETAELKKGTMSVGVGRQHAGITGQTGL